MPWHKSRFKNNNLIPWLFGFAAFLWVLARCGLNPKRLSYPCQRAALPIATGWILAVLAFLTGSIILRRFARISGAVLSIAAVIWFMISISDETLSAERSAGELPEWKVADPISKVFAMDAIPYTSGSLAAGNMSVPDEFLNDPAMDTLFEMMADGGVPPYKSISTPDGIIGNDNIVIIKANFQWAGRNTTSADRIKGLIWRILQHPDGFSGEIIVCDNTQDNGTGINQMDNNSEDESQSIVDVISTFYSKGYPVYLLDWNYIWDVVAEEYSAGDYNDGYIYKEPSKVTYPKFRSPSGNYYISAKYGIWNENTGEYDLDKLCLINFPVLKAHYWSGSTAAIKNWVGLMTTAYSEERYESWYYMHEWHIFGKPALVARVMAETYPKLSIVDATWTARTGPNNFDHVNTRMLAASTDPVAVSWYTTKYILTPVARAPEYTDPDNNYIYSVHLRRWSDTLRYSRGFPCTRDSSEISVYDRFFPDPGFLRVFSGEYISNGGHSFGSAWGDYNNDDFPDLFVANSIYPSGLNNDLHINNTNGTFSKIEEEIIVSDGGVSSGATWGDYNNDGNLDLFVANMSPNYDFLYANNGDGSFTKMIETEMTSTIDNSTTASWVDYDNDGHLDLFISQLGSNALFHNENGAFARISTGSIVIDNEESYGASWSDYDNDGDADLYVCVSGNGLNCFYRNDGNGYFTKITDLNIVSENGESYGASWGDYDNDGDFDLFVANISNVTDGHNFLYRNNGDGTFTSVMNGAIVSDGGYSTGSAWGDYDNDGDLDLFVANWLEDGIGENFLYENQGGTFSRVTATGFSSGMTNPNGAAWADYDRDGDIDLYVTNSGGEGEKNSLYRNIGNDNGWIGIKCLGLESNRSAIGARVYLKATIGGSAVRQSREISGQTGYCGQNSLEVHFGLGDATMIDSIIVEWPGKRSANILTDIDINQFLTITEILCGDCNDDNLVNILDIVYMINYKYKAGPVPESPDLADVNHDASINILDIVYLINNEYKNGPKPDCL